MTEAGGDCLRLFLCFAVKMPLVPLLAALTRVRGLTFAACILLG